MHVRIFFAFCLIALSAGAANAVPSITVSGTGDSVAVPDQFTFTAVVEERGEVVTKLQQTVSHKVNQIVTHLLDAGVDHKQIQSMQISLTPSYERTATGSRQNGFVLSRQINVVVKQLDDYAGVVDGVIAAGAARLERFQFGLSNSEAVYQRALQSAFDNARERALVLAKQAGVELGNVLSMTEHGNARSMPVTRQMMMAESAAADLPGQVVSSSTVQVVFEIKQ
ncbi:SIMPL domain-containing protein [Aestuariibacter salexigens]|uniref:SIMPL domain-containing protein n=1 Tax=Aestuariibacter salexigens TaxID=226010 RepID=UPI0003FADDAA|nr:SIMPL domain-containing protein [Aestuariibacter salexigens]